MALRGGHPNWTCLEGCSELVSSPGEGPGKSGLCQRRQNWPGTSKRTGCKNAGKILGFFGKDTGHKVEDKNITAVKPFTRLKTNISVTERVDPMEGWEAQRTAYYWHQKKKKCQEKPGVVASVIPAFGR
jgi:hypothetical protein